jgi:DNA-binding NarL/FixJ family response regulator
VNPWLNLNLLQPTATSLVLKKNESGQHVLQGQRNLKILLVLKDEGRAMKLRLRVWIEVQTLVMIASGKRLSDIAEELTLSPKTVSVYRARVLEKLGLSNNSEMTVYAIRHGLVGE